MYNILSYDHTVSNANRLQKGSGNRKIMQAICVKCEFVSNYNWVIFQIGFFELVKIRRYDHFTSTQFKADVIFKSLLLLWRSLAETFLTMPCEIEYFAISHPEVASLN